MRNVSDAFLAEVARSHTVAILVESYFDGAKTGEIDEVVSGSVTLDRRASIRGTCDLSIVDDGSLGLIPTEATDTLAPYGQELRIWRGVRFLDGTTELVSLGFFRIQDVETDDSGSDLALRIAGLGREAFVSDAKFEDPYEVASGTLVTDELETLVTHALPNVVTDYSATSVAVPKLIASEGGDRWGFARGLANSLGGETYFDGDGVNVLHPIPTPAGDPAYEVSEGGVLIAASKRWTRDGTFNRSIVTGESTDVAGTPPRGVATDDDANSPTYYYGPYGKVVDFWASEFITNQTQADDAAAGRLADVLGTTQSVSFTTVVNPALEPSDIVLINRERAGIANENHVIDQLNISLDSSATMSGETRSVVV